MHTAYSHPARPFNLPAALPAEIAWGITALFAWLGLPFLRELLVWALLKLYEMFVMYI
jgi:hypothetical protein